MSKSAKKTATPAENPNHNCLSGMACPHCGDFGPFKIYVTQSGMTDVSDSGTGHIEGDTEWDDDAACHCYECGYDGTVRQFRGNPDPVAQTLTKDDLLGLGYEIGEDSDQPGMYCWRNDGDESALSYESEAEAIAAAAQDAVQSNDLHRCDNCGKVHSGQTLAEIKDYSMRVDAGGTAPSGECPDCGALCYPLEVEEDVTSESAFDKVQQVVVESYADGEFSLHTPAQIPDCGDGLLKFLLSELSEAEDCDSFDTAVSRLDTAIKELAEVRSAFAAKLLA